MGTDDDERVGWRGALFGAAAVAVASALVIGGLWLRVTLVEADAMDAMAILDGDLVLVAERVHGGDGETSLPGGARLVAVDARTGALRARTRIDGRELLGRYGEGTGKIWLRVTEGGLEARSAGGPNLLDVVEREADLVARLPDLRALARSPNTTCLERATGAVRTTTDDGRHVAYDLAREVVSPSLRPGCGPWTATASSVRLADGRLLATEERPGTERRELGLRRADAPRGEPAEPVGVEGLDLELLADPTSSGASPMRPLQVGPHVLVLRRTSRADDAETELARVDVEARREVWSARLGRPRGRLVAAAVVGATGVLVVQDEGTVRAVDLTSGAVLWGRGRGT